mmetsp:Transcript_13157/g.22987  ORF Transcript_13157/g.22987 Transcript_13157/m.22987 type:complete len:92 (+) Transcript_13157:147-422(+)
MQSLCRNECIRLINPSIHPSCSNNSVVSYDSSSSKVANQTPAVIDHAVMNDFFFFATSRRHEIFLDGATEILHPSRKRGDGFRGSSIVFVL